MPLRRAYKGLRVKPKKVIGNRIRRGKRMEVLTNVAELRTSSYSVLDMIMDSKKREDTFRYFDDKYTETTEEKEIFETMTNRRKKGRR